MAIAFPCFLKMQNPYGMLQNESVYVSLVPNWLSLHVKKKVNHVRQKSGDPLVLFRFLVQIKHLPL